MATTCRTRASSAMAATPTTPTRTATSSTTGTRTGMATDRADGRTQDRRKLPSGLRPTLAAPFDRPASHAACHQDQRSPVVLACRVTRRGGTRVVPPRRLTRTPVARSPGAARQGPGLACLGHHQVGLPDRGHTHHQPQLSRLARGRHPTRPVDRPRHRHRGWPPPVPERRWLDQAEGGAAVARGHEPDPAPARPCRAHGGAAGRYAPLRSIRWAACGAIVATSRPAPGAVMWPCPGPGRRRAASRRGRRSALPPDRSPHVPVRPVPGRHRAHARRVRPGPSDRPFRHLAVAGAPEAASRALSARERPGDAEPSPGCALRRRRCPPCRSSRRSAMSDAAMLAPSSPG